MVLRTVASWQRRGDLSFLTVDVRLSSSDSFPTLAFHDRTAQKDRRENRGTKRELTFEAHCV